MHIGIDISSVIFNRGVSRYTKNLTMALLEENNVDLSLYGASLRQFNQLQNIGEELLEEYSDSKLKVQPYPPTLLRWLWRFGFNKVDALLPDIDVFHSWDWLQPPDKSLPLVSTIHDLAMLKFPETAHPKIKKMHQRSWEVLKERQAHIIAVSRSTKNDIIDLLGYPQYLVHVVHEALPRDFRALSQSITEQEHEAVKARLKLDRPFILFVGTREPRKNLVRLIQAWEPLSGEVDLLIAGESGWDASAGLNTTALQQKGLRFLGRVSDTELVVLYAEAHVFAYPSLYEGFGLPILEAFHTGTPVVTSSNSGMQEVAGNAGVLVDPYDVTDIRRGLTTVLEESVAEQQKRLQRMIIRLQMFNWKTVAKETVSVYKQAIADFSDK